jgi:hypothetical protein
VEQDGLLTSRLSTQQWFALARGEGGPSDLAWLLGRLGGLACPSVVLDRLFEGLDLHIRWRLEEAGASITGLRFPPRPLHVHRSLQRGLDPSLLDRPLPPVRPLPPAGASRLIEVARASLLVRHRETDPVTHANPRETTLVPLERGVDVALFGMQPERRLPIESFFGYVVAKNRLPAGYGGGWIFLDRAEIGINVFDPFRGGESSYVFGQILRVYRQHYGVRRFLVDPFQFGADNTEGIRSGAFWFYYRLGFRPLDASLCTLAADEWDRLQRDRSRRTPTATLRRLATAKLCLEIEPADAPVPDLPSIGLAVTELLGRRFGADREAAVRWSRRRVTRLLGTRPGAGWSPQEQAAFQRLCPLVALLPGLESWGTPDRRSLAALMRAKGGPRERGYVQRIQRHRRLQEALRTLSACSA